MFCVRAKLHHSEHEDSDNILTARNRFGDLRIRQVIAQTTIINPALVPLDISGFVSKFKISKYNPVLLEIEDDDVITFSVIALFLVIKGNKRKKNGHGLGSRILGRINSLF